MAALGASRAREGASPQSQAVEGTVVGFDFGARRVGVAVGETSTRIASALHTIDAGANAARFREIDRIVGEWRPVALVVGQPRHPDGGEHAVGKLAEKFARRLAERYRLPVTLIDETLTSAMAETHLRETTTRRARRGEVDALAAAMILQSYLDALPRSVGA